MAAVSGNAWKGKGQGGAERAPTQTPSVPTEQHVPVKDFNAGEVREFLKKSKRTELAAGHRLGRRASRRTPELPRRIASCL